MRVREKRMEREERKRGSNSTQAVVEEEEAFSVFEYEQNPKINQIMVPQGISVYRFCLALFRLLHLPVGYQIHSHSP